MSEWVSRIESLVGLVCMQISKRIYIFCAFLNLPIKIVSPCLVLLISDTIPSIAYKVLCHVRYPIIFYTHTFKATLIHNQI